MSGVREKGGGGDGSLSVLAWHEPARRGVVSLRRRGTMRSDAAWRDATHRGVARIEPSRFNVARDGRGSGASAVTGQARSVLFGSSR